MSHRHIIGLLGGALIVLGAAEGGWALLAAWLGCNFLILSVAHAKAAHGVFGKRSDGTLPLWSRILFLPLYLYTLAVWHLLRLFTREPAYNVVSDHLIVGRRLLPFELQQRFDNYVDLTAELSEPSAIVRTQAYRSFPILDGTSPTPEALRSAVDLLKPGSTFIHCAQGHGRTGLFALAVLLSSRAVPSVEDGVRMLQSLRPAIRLSRAQRRCIQAYYDRLP